MALTYSAIGRASNSLRLAVNAPLKQAFSSLRQLKAPSDAFRTSLGFPSVQTFPLHSVSASALQSDSGFRKPDVIEWQEDMITNRATLIGLIIREVRIKYLDSGKIVANSSLKVSRPTREDSWFYLEFWGDLAEVAAAHLKVDDSVFVAGSVSSEKVQGKDGIERVLAKVLVEDLKFIKPIRTGEGNVKVQNLYGEAIWEYLFENPTEWFDCRVHKGNSRFPDFKHVSNLKSLWIDSTGTPNWVEERLKNELDVNFLLFRPVEQRWKDFFADPSKWWDNRFSKYKKTNPRVPDFKHKLTGEALWIDEDDKNLQWVKAKLSSLDSIGRE